MICSDTCNLLFAGVALYQSGFSICQPVVAMCLLAKGSPPYGERFLCVYERSCLILLFSFAPVDFDDQNYQQAQKCCLLYLILPPGSSSSGATIVYSSLSSFSCISCFLRILSYISKKMLRIYLCNGGASWYHSSGRIRIRCRGQQLHTHCLRWYKLRQSSILHCLQFLSCRRGNC